MYVNVGRVSKIGASRDGFVMITNDVVFRLWEQFFQKQKPPLHLQSIQDNWIKSIQTRGKSEKKTPKYFPSVGLCV